MEKIRGYRDECGSPCLKIGNTDCFIVDNGDITTLIDKNHMKTILWFENKKLQDLVESGDERAKAVFDTKNKKLSGRPKGAKNKKLKLDDRYEEIIGYLKIGISKASIAKLIGCHPQTLYSWFLRRNINLKNKEQKNVCE